MNENIKYSADYQNSNTTALFDRIINIKFTRRNGDFFTLRSDYEPVWEGGLLYFKTCQPKPEIRIKYVQYDSTLIDVDIFVTNLNIIESKPNKISAGSFSGIKSNLSSDILTDDGNPVVKAEIEMGYRGQFFNWGKQLPNILTQEQNYEAFLNLCEPVDYEGKKKVLETQNFFSGLRSCTIEIEWAIHTNNPPDRITQFHGYVGGTAVGAQSSEAVFSLSTPAVKGSLLTIHDMLSSLDDAQYPVGTIDITNKVQQDVQIKNKKKKAKTIPKQIYSPRNLFNGGNAFTPLEAYCFHLFTRRFIRNGVSHKRNILMERAYLKYVLSTEYDDSTNSLRTLRDAVENEIFAVEIKAKPEYFVRTENAISYSNIAPSEYKQALDESIDKILLEHFTGSHYTVKNLPEYRSLYKAIRKQFEIAKAKGQYLTWDDAAKQAVVTASSSLERTNKVDKNFSSVCNFLLKAERSEMTNVDSYYESYFGNDWFLPVQPSTKGKPLKTVKNKSIYFYPPDTVTSDGFAASSKKIKEERRSFSGLFEIQDAYMLGIPVHCSAEASKSFQKKLGTKDTIEFVTLPTAKAQIEWLCTEYGLSYKTSNNGGFQLFASYETVEKALTEEYITEQKQPFRIPAIYDITLSPTRTIRMPFFAFLSPMSTIEWNSTTAIGEMPSFYFQPEKGRNFFSIISSTVDFSTTEEYNTMELSVYDVNIPEEKASIPVETVRKSEALLFNKVLITPGTKYPTWDEIYNKFFAKIPVSFFPAWEEKNLNKKMVPGIDFFNLMKEWNPSLFAQSTQGENGWEWDDSAKRIDKKATNKYGKNRTDKKVFFPNIQYCMDKLSDTKLKRIYLCTPALPTAISYTVGEDVVKEEDSASIWILKDKTITVVKKEEAKASFILEVQ